MGIFFLLFDLFGQQPDIDEQGDHRYGNEYVYTGDERLHGALGCEILPKREHVFVKHHPYRERVEKTGAYDSADDARDQHFYNVASRRRVLEAQSRDNAVSGVAEDEQGIDSAHRYDYRAEHVRNESYRAAADRTEDCPRYQPYKVNKRYLEAVGECQNLTDKLHNYSQRGKYRDVSQILCR